jgi:protein-disulfide isomerase
MTPSITDQFSTAAARRTGLAIAATAALGISLLWPAAAPDHASAPRFVTSAHAQGTSAFSPDQRKQIEAIIKDYLVSNPEVMMEVQQALEAKMEKIQAERMSAALKENSAAIFRNASAPVAGNPKGDVTVVEFFDYNCGYCKKALVDLMAAADKDKNLKLVLKEFPILSKGSEETARVALAAKVQGKYWEFHRAMLETQGQANEASALRVAERVGLNIPKLKTDMASADVKKHIDDVRQLAQKLGIQGTPHFLVGDKPIGGAPDGLADMIVSMANDVRKSGGCKVC